MLGTRTYPIRQRRAWDAGGGTALTQPRAPSPAPAQADPAGGHRAEVAEAAASAPISLPPRCASFEGKLGEEAGVSSQAHAPQLHFVPLYLVKALEQ